MAASGLSGSLPAGSVAFVDGNGVLTPYGRNLLNALIQRTGGAPGTDISAVATQAAAAQATANTANSTALKKAANLSDLSNLVAALGNLQLVIQHGWSAPTGGAGSRGPIDTSFTTAVSNPPTQAQVQAIETQLEAVSKGLGQLIIDLEAFKAIGP